MSGPDLVDLTRVGRVNSHPLDPFGQDPDADQPTAEYGEQIVEAQIAKIAEHVDRPGPGRRAFHSCLSTSPNPLVQLSGSSDRNGWVVEQDPAGGHRKRSDRTSSPPRRRVVREASVSTSRKARAAR